MTLTLAAVPNAAGDAVVLTVAGASTAAPVTLERRDRNGQAPVRVRAGTALAAGAFTTTDYEVALDGPATYLAVDDDGRAAYATTTLAGQVDLPQLRPTFRPTQVATVRAVLNLGGARELRRSAHEVLLRPDVVFTTYGLGLRSGSMTLRCATLADAAGVQRLYARGDALLLRLPDHALDLAHIGTTVDPQPQERRADGQRWWDVVVAFTEVTPAAGDALSGFTLGDLAALHATLGAAALAYPVLGDLGQQ